ncbi:MAG: N-6 DNA methylase [Ignavibacteriaceae bacterium]|nr:N-6 DNA methylase [Ignavibacteriaceae bacterium]
MINKEEAYQKIAGLVKRFEEQIDSYKKSDYNETLTRQDFINPFFKTLGWDIDNEQGYAEAYREVIHEDKIKVGGATKAPDYSFRLVGGKKLFFVEAKKPSVVVKDEIPPAYQIRRYGWSAKLPISIITDFEEFSIYDCTIKPNPTDKASTARIKYLTFREYLKEFDFIWETFSKEQVLKGSFDKFVQSDTQKKGTATVDKEFLQSLDSWRTYLATSIAINNKQLDEDEINFAVQQIIDRIIFLRIAEDRSVEPYGNLKNALERGGYYKNLFEQFQRADEKYNSGIFDFKKDRISEHLIIENKIVKTIITDLYYPSPFAFDVMPVEILGTAYEQFLGKVIRITPAHHAKIEEKPEVRKAGGVYYTPQYIVEYIVKNTVGKLIDGKTPKEISKIKIVDPACGSGSFLLGAYQYLLDYHKNYYSENGKPSKGKKDNPLTPAGNLTTAEKKRILLNNIFGVDIDVNAVEVTKLSLLLKCMEGETSNSIAHQLSFFNERVLPTLDENIKSGNSLISTDIYDYQLDFGDEKKIKPFNWKKEFPDVFNIKTMPSAEPPQQEKLKKALSNMVGAEKELNNAMRDYIHSVKEPQVSYGLMGGFDIVIGNPPYIKIQNLVENQPKGMLNYFYEHYKSGQDGNYDIYVLFIEKGYSLLNEKGMLGFINPHKFFNSNYGKNLRQLLIEKECINEIVHFDDYQIFECASTYTCLLFLQKEKKNKFKAIKINSKTFTPGILKRNLDFITLNHNDWQNKDWNITTKSSNKLLSKLFVKPTLKEITTNIFQGPKAGADYVFILRLIEEKTNHSILFSKSLNRKVTIENSLIKKYVKGKFVKKYFLDFSANEVEIFPYIGNTLITEIQLKNNYPKSWDYFDDPINKSLLKAREDGRFSKTFWQYSRPQNMNILSKEKILTPFNAFNNSFSYDSLGDFVFSAGVSGAYGILLKDENHSYKYLLGVLNSKVIQFIIRNISTCLRGGYYSYENKYLKQLPIPKEDTIHSPNIIKLVDQLLKLNKEKAEAKLETKINQLKSKIDYCESKINKIVYQLYDLTPEEIKIVERK